jgi:hypothetical protein
MYPKYSMWEAISASLSLGMRAIEEVRAIASRPPPRDGFGFDDLSFDYDGERTLTLRFTKGDETKEFPINLPIPIYRGVYRDGEEYKKGDTTTWAGSVWIARDNTINHPRDGVSWQLAVKAGRDGRKI